MFRQLIVFSALVAMAYSSCCSIEDRKEVLQLWESVWSAEFTARRVAIASEVFQRLFDKAPDAKGLFSRVKVEDPESAEWKAHVIRVSNGLDTCINLAFDSDALDKQLAHLKEQHKGYDGLRAEFFTKFREAFAEVLPQAVPCFNAAAWNRCLAGLHEKMTP